MQASEIRARLSAMGFEQVDDTIGFRPAFKWRHRSAFHSQRHGSLWVHEGGELHAVGKRAGGYEWTLPRWVKPTRVDTSLSNSFSVWEGAELERLMTEMERRITPKSTWPVRP